MIYHQIYYNIYFYCGIIFFIGDFMKDILIITDSCCDLPEKNNLKHTKILPYSFYFKGDRGTVYKDLFKYSNRDYYQRINIGVEAIPLPLDYNDVIKTLEEAREKDMDVIILHSTDIFGFGISSLLKDAKEEIQYGKIDMNITIIDSHQTSLSLGLLVSKVDSLISEGKSYNEVVEYILKNRDYYCLDFVSFDNDHLLQKKVIAKRKLLLPDLLKLKNVFSVRKSGIYVKKTLLDNVMPIDYMVDDIRNHYDSQEEIGLLHVHNEEGMDTLARKVQKEKVLGRKIITETSKVTGSYMGPNTLGVAYKKL